MIWPSMWSNKSIVTINAMLYILDIYIYTYRVELFIFVGI